LKVVGTWRLVLWTPRALARNEKRLLAELKAGRLPLVVPAREMPRLQLLTGYRPHVECNTFQEAQAILETGTLATFLPSFLNPNRNAPACRPSTVPGVTTKSFHYHFAWNPRLLRLNPHAIRVRDSLLVALAKLMNDARR